MKAKLFLENMWEFSLWFFFAPYKVNIPMYAGEFFLGYFFVPYKVNIPIYAVGFNQLQYKEYIYWTQVKIYISDQTSLRICNSVASSVFDLWRPFWGRILRRLFAPKGDFSGKKSAVQQRRYLYRVHIYIKDSAPYGHILGTSLDQGAVQRIRIWRVSSVNALYETYTFLDNTIMNRSMQMHCKPFAIPLFHCIH